LGYEFYDRSPVQELIVDYTKLSQEDLQRLLENAQRCLDHKKKAWKKRAPIVIEEVENELRFRRRATTTANPIG
jgi:hypothetical protein